MSSTFKQEDSTSSSAKEFGVPWPHLNDGLNYSDFVSPSHSCTLSPSLSLCSISRDSHFTPANQLFFLTASTLIDFYSTNHANSAPLQGWLQRIKNGQISVDGTITANPNALLRDGSQLVYHRQPWTEPDVPYLLKILYEDDDMIALDKPSGLQVLPGGLFQQRTVLMQLQWWANKQSSSSVLQVPAPVPVHRLGRGTSGILLCAKTKVAKTRLAAYFADGTSKILNKRDINKGINLNRKISKVYRALVTGIIQEDEVVIEQPIGMIQYPGVAKGLYVASPTGKPALSKVIVLERDVKGNCTFVQVQIQSGRPHQIRIHLATIGHPLLGDPLYVSGGQPKCLDSDPVDDSFAQDGGYPRPMKPLPGDCGYHLHAHQLVLLHPATNEVIEITAPVPSALQTPQERQRKTAHFLSSIVQDSNKMN